jgi:hypothetical protein
MTHLLPQASIACKRSLLQRETPMPSVSDRRFRPDSGLGTSSSLSFHRRAINVPGPDNPKCGLFAPFSRPSLCRYIARYRLGARTPQCPANRISKFHGRVLAFRSPKAKLLRRPVRRLGENARIAVSFDAPVAAAVFGALAF